MIPFNKPYLTGKEGHNIYQAVLSGKNSGDGVFTKKCHDKRNGIIVYSSNKPNPLIDPSMVLQIITE
jgi:hypothetical protein